MSVDESSSANESSSGATTPPITNSRSSTNKNLKKLKRPPAPSLTSKTNQKNLEQNGGSNQNNSNNQVPEIISNNNKEVTDNNNVLGLVTCAVCGKQFGKNSVKFHTRQCQKRQQIIKERQVISDEKKTSPSAVSEPIEEVEGTILNKFSGKRLNFARASLRTTVGRKGSATEISTFYYYFKAVLLFSLVQFCDLSK